MDELGVFLLGSGNCWLNSGERACLRQLCHYLPLLDEGGVNGYGKRTNPLWNNVPRNLSGYLFDDWSYKPGENYLYCFEQANKMVDYLNNLQDSSTFDDHWEFIAVWEDKENAHHWVEAHSSNPNDPVLTIDPFNNFIKIK